MKGKNIITINGRAYDAITGMPLTQTEAPASHQVHEAKPQQPKSEPSAHKQPQPDVPVHKPLRAFSDVAATRQAPQAAKPVRTAAQGPAKTSAHAMHRQLQKSQTLHPALRRPTQPRQAAPTQTNHHEQPRAVHQRSSTISKFAPEKPASTPEPVLKKQLAEAQQATEANVAPKVHPVVAKALERQTQKVEAAKQLQPQSSKELKEMLIKERLAQVDTEDKKKEKRSFMKRRPRLTTILTSTLVTLLLGGYLVYMNLPNISMRVAATRAGISANFPDYKPDGYSFQGPITYSPGEVNISFKSNTSNQDFIIKQKSSNWDSQAVLDNYVSRQTDTYLTYQERGLTIYSFGNKAAWVNGGLLYSIEGSAQLSGEQLLRIAASM